MAKRLTAADFVLLNADAAKILAFNKALEYLQENSGLATELLSAALARGTKVMFPDGVVNSGTFYSEPNRLVVWDPTQAIIVFDEQGHPKGVQSAANGLIHEFGHAVTENQKSQIFVENSQYTNASEAIAVTYADAVARDCGEVTRDNYQGGALYVENVTVHTDGGGKWRQLDSDGRFTFGDYFDGNGRMPEFSPQGSGGFSPWDTNCSDPSPFDGSNAPSANNSGGGSAGGAAGSGSSSGGSEGESADGDGGDEMPKASTTLAWELATKASIGLDGITEMRDPANAFPYLTRSQLLVGLGIELIDRDIPLSIVEADLVGVVMAHIS